MRGTRFADGFDRPDVIAFGLTAPRLLVAVLSGLAAYASVHGLESPLGWVAATVIVIAGSLTVWGRVQGRVISEWVALGALHITSRRQRTLVVTRQPQVAAPAPPNPPPARPASIQPRSWRDWLEDDPQTAVETAPTPTIDTRRATPLVVLPTPGNAETRDTTEPQPAPSIVPLRPEASEAIPVSPAPNARLAAAAAPAPMFIGATRRIVFFSLNGGTGRTTIATELACVLASRGRHQRPDGTPASQLQVALLDLDTRSANISIRLGLTGRGLWDYLTDPADSEADVRDFLLRHSSGARVLLGAPKPLGSSAPVSTTRLNRLIRDLDSDGTQFTIIDIAADLGAVTMWALDIAHDVIVVLTPTARGLQDAYRTTEFLRRAGLRHKLSYVVNRGRGAADFSEAMADLGGRIIGELPHDTAVDESETTHRLLAGTDSGPFATALVDLAGQFYPGLVESRPRGRWARWRRRRVS